MKSSELNECAQFETYCKRYGNVVLFSVLLGSRLPHLAAFISAVHRAVFFNMHVEVSTLYS
jgi:hypothetical protein